MLWYLLPFLFLPFPLAGGAPGDFQAVEGHLSLRQGM